MSEKTANAAQAMVFVLTMSLFGLATLFSELIPRVCGVLGGILPLYSIAVGNAAGSSVSRFGRNHW